MLRPKIGESSMGMTTLLQITPHCTTTPAARAAPARPPMSACDDDDGRPNHHVMRFQPVAPTRAAATSHSPLTPLGASMMPEPIVAATLPPKKAPNRLATAAMARATRGVRALVETE